MANGITGPLAGVVAGREGARRAQQTPPPETEEQGGGLRPMNFLRDLLGSTPATQRRAVARQSRGQQLQNRQTEQQIAARNAIAELMGSEAFADPGAMSNLRMSEAQQTQAQTQADRAEQARQQAEQERRQGMMLNAARLMEDTIGQASEAGASPQELGRIFDQQSRLIQQVDPSVDDEMLAGLREQVVRDPSVLGRLRSALDPEAQMNQRQPQAIGAPQQVQIPGTDEVGLAVPVDLGNGQIGQEFLRDESGEPLRAARFQRGLTPEGEFTEQTPQGPRAQVIPGASAEAELEETRTGTERTRQQIEESERERRQARISAQQRAEGAESRFELVEENIDQAIEQANNFTTGLGSLASIVPGTPQADLANTLSTIQANIGFDELQRLRDMSPTGGAVGQVSERELGFLQSVLGSVEQSQSDEQLKDNLRRLKDQLRNSAERVREAFEADFGVQPQMGDGGPFDMRFPAQNGGRQQGSTQQSGGNGGGGDAPQFRRNPDTGVWEPVDGN